MEFDRQIEGSCGLEDGFGFFDGKGNAFTKGINGICQAIRDYPWERLVAYDIQVVLVAFLEFRGKCVSAQKRGFDVNRAERPEFSRDAEHFHFGFYIQAVA